ncbi:porin [Burkholderia sp. L27(2015)]|uniref:porin n=1 Tax=Burkholderia sp. L27(2015) TaxID=1641858 RepID=UPI00131EABF2|nr:porin [Burkholderia sp. L27(2015)]
MKRVALSSLAIAMLAAASAAHAQSSVTLYGIIDVGIGYTHNDTGVSNFTTANHSTQVGFNNGTLSGSRWGLKGTEDLGGGLSTIFQLENGFSPTTGGFSSAGVEFNRQAYVGLSSTTWGTVTFGRQYDPTVDMVQPLTEDNYFGSIFGTPGDVDNYDNNFRVSNTIKYVSPTFNGLQFEGIYGLGGVAGSVSAGQSYGAGVSYTNGGLGLAAAYFVAKTSSQTAFTSTTDNDFGSVINGGFANSNSLAIGRVGGQYAFGPFTAGASYSNTRYKPVSAFVAGNSKTEEFNSGAVFLNYNLTPAALVGIGYNLTRSSGVSGATYHEVSLGSDYNLSKRTDVYLVGAWQKANGQTVASVNGVQTVVAAPASIGSYGINSGTSSQAIAIIGMRHKF